MFILTFDSFDSDGINAIGDIINNTNGPTFTYNIRLDDDPSADRTASFLGNLTLQIDRVCDDLLNHPVLSQAPAINALAFSQGSQFMRAYVERCNNPPVANLVTFGGQHNGISEFQACKNGDWVCQAWDSTLKSNTWTDFVQSRLVPAQYFRDPENLDDYLEHSNFLADINNERDSKNATYKENLKKLEKFVMFMFSDDTTVVPKESAYFYEVNTTSNEVTKLRDRTLYQEDWLGLKWLDEQNRLEFRVAKGGHMQFEDGLLEKTMRRYFSGKVSSSVSGYGVADSIEL